MLDIQGLSLSDKEKEQLAHPLVGGLILFSRNYSDIKQLTSLIAQIRQVTGPDFIIAVDHEGGRVQRFRAGFTEIPAMGAILKYHQGDIQKAIESSTELGWLMASELLAFDIDISFAPILDLDICSNVIGQRAFSGQPDEVIQLARGFINGMSQAGMACTGKHFPGHGSVVADSHIDLPVDDRSKQHIKSLDQSVFDSLIEAQAIDALMPAHVIYPQFCDKPAGFSKYWLQEVLRTELAFDGVIFSDDLGMEGASVAGDFCQRTQAALSAGCDMALVCNNPDAAQEVLSFAEHRYNEIVSLDAQKSSQQRLRRMLKSKQVNLKSLQQSERWDGAVAMAAKIRK
ncbi:beta-N-acetylhexosaminidase [Psychrobium sp. 1_MG-2023]|uniref:beta-N-acetylhexosaminidase n=1 Tax=Psychrobium sp. 1_MG-2023 TaxID=3062624 RepID=UPI0026B7CCD5|nr:beta-N-acetylhexosaminidase [Psychrobium sp. 1_MG-2023]MDP2560211.1 beta-N-acetylhexosaminidase [Psychrobium sp. 1_MG-2023]